MKKRKRFNLISLIFYTVLFGVIILLYIGLKLEIEKKTKEKTNLEEILYTRKNENTMLMVEVQKLKDEERIVPLAESRLGLIKFNSPDLIIEVDPEELEQVIKIINSKYE
jgi:cell division protein FtsL